MHHQQYRPDRHWFLVGITHLVSVLGLFSSGVQATTLEDALAAVDTGSMASAACKQIVKTLIGSVAGLGGKDVSNVTADDDSVSADVGLPIGGTWTIDFFAPDCSKDVYALLIPESDLKFSDFVANVTGLGEVDKLGLASQAFVLSDTEGSISAANVSDSIATKLAAATDGDDAFEVEVKPGLTVLGVADLSRSDLTKKALSFIGLKNADSQKIAIESDLGADMLASIVAGEKPQPDFSLTGSMPDVTLTLPGGYQLPAAALTFNTTVSEDGKEFGFNIEVADEWSPALGIPGLALSEVSMAVTAAEDTSASLSAITTIDSQELDVSWQAEKGDDTAVSLTLAAPEGKDFNIGSIGGLSKVPGLKELAFTEIDVSQASFDGKMSWNGKALEAAVIFIEGESKKTPVVLFENESFKLKDISKAIDATPLGAITFPSLILTLAETSAGNVDVDDLPSVAAEILGDLADKSGGKIDFKQGVGALAVLDHAALGNAGKALGITSGEFIIGGNLGGLFGGDPEIDLYAALPTFSSSKVPAFLKAAKDVTPQLSLAFKEAGGSAEADIGVDLVTDFKVGDQTIQLDTSIKTVIADSGVGLDIGGTLDEWQGAFGLHQFDLSDVAVSIGVDVDGSVSAGIQATVTLKDDATHFTIETLLTPDPEALGLPKEVVFKLTANQISLKGFTDLADVFIGSTGNNSLAKAANGKGLYKTLQLNKLPEIELVQYKNDDGSLEDVEIYLATPGASDPELDIDGMGMGIEGRLRIAGKDIAQVKADMTDENLNFDGEVLIHKLGPLDIKEAKLDAEASLSELPHFHLIADAELLGVKESIEVEFDNEKVGFDVSSKFGQAFTSNISAWATGVDVENPDFDVHLEFTGDLLDYVLAGIEKELDKLDAQYKKDAEDAKKALKAAQNDIDSEEKKVDSAIKTAEADIEKASADIDKAIAKVQSVQNNINDTKGDVHDKEHALHKLHFYEVGKAIKLGIEIAALEVELGGLYAGKGTALAALEVAKSSVNLAPAIFQPAVLAANGVFEAAKGALTVASVSVDASEAALKGLEDAIESYRKNFKFKHAEFDGSLQALLGNKSIKMDAEFIAFGDDVKLDLSFKPADPAAIGKAVDDMIADLAEDAVKSVENDFFGGGGSGGGSSNSGSGKTYSPPAWTPSDSPGGNSIPTRGVKYTNAAENKCLTLTNDKIVLGACKGVDDSILFRISPKGDFVAVGSDPKAPQCLTASGPDTGADVALARCADQPLQKWRLDGDQLSIATATCLAASGNALKMVDCGKASKNASWQAESVADLKKLSETPATALYTMSFRTPDGATCVDSEDHRLLEYDCDDSDFQVYNLKSNGQLKVGDQCVIAQRASKGSGMFVGDCAKTTNKWQWIGDSMKLEGTQFCMARGAPLLPGLNAINLDSCASAAAKWELEPANVDPKGRILPSYAMMQLAGDKCIEVRSKMQIDGLPIPASMLWSCTGDFNQGFSFRWNGEIRTMGHCLAPASDKKGALVNADECLVPPDPLMSDFFSLAGKNRQKQQNQHWKINSNGTIQKKGTKLCLSADPNGLYHLSFNPFIAPGGQLPTPRSGKPGGIGSLLVLDKCNAKSDLQQWTVSSKLPDGSDFAGYQTLSHSLAGKERCLETSGDDKFRKIISRTCQSGNNYQTFAVANNNEIRQMGRCVTTMTANPSNGDGFEMELAECSDEATQKWTVTNAKTITQQAAPRADIAMSMALSAFGGSQFAAIAQQQKVDASKPKAMAMCLTEGVPFGPSVAIPGLPAQMKTAMQSLPSFALVSLESCAVAYKNAAHNNCMMTGSKGVISAAKCNTADAFAHAQAFGLNNGFLTRRRATAAGFSMRKVWIDAAVSQNAASVETTPDLAHAGGNATAAFQTMFKNYAAQGWLWDSTHKRLRYNSGNKHCMAGTASGPLTLAACGSAKAQQWSRVPVGSTVWHLK